MSIYGIGIDIVQIKRIESIFTKYGDRFVRRMLNSIEITNYLDFCNSFKKQVSFLAKRFAVKESVIKALGFTIPFKSIVIQNNNQGKPYVNLITTHTFLDVTDKRYNISISISDDYPIAIAFCVIEVEAL